jgi:hypothetical protein
VVFVHDGVVHVFEMQICDELHGFPQLMMLPHPSEAGPHWRPRLVHVCALHVEGPHTFAPPPPHACPVVHEPQLITPPQPSGYVPQFIPVGHAFSGVHAGAPH